MMGNSDLGGLGELMQNITAMLEKKKAQAQARQKLKDAGFSHNQIGRAFLHVDTYTDQAGALSYYLCLAVKDSDKEAAQLGILTANFMRDRTTEQHNMFKAAGVDFASLGLQDKLPEVAKRMNHLAGVFRQVLDGGDFSGQKAGDIIRMIEPEETAE